MEEYVFIGRDKVTGARFSGEDKDEIILPGYCVSNVELAIITLFTYIYFNPRNSAKTRYISSLLRTALQSEKLIG